MSLADRRKWDQRYRDGAYATRPHPSAFLASCAAMLPRRGQALDLACGTGRNAIFLARRGLTVDAVDISPVALELGRARAGTLPIRWLQRDLDDGLRPDRDYHLIVNIRYVKPSCIASLVPSLSAGGLLVVEQHLLSDEPGLVGPKSPNFRVAPGELQRLARGLTIERLEEGLFDEPDGVAALARLVARNTSGDKLTGQGVAA